MAANSIAKYIDSVTHKEVNLSLDDIRKNFCPAATEQEALNFLRLCEYMGLNPFVRDAYLIKYGDAPASMVVGKDAFTKRADAHPQFSGIESGIIVTSGESEPVHRKGTLLLGKETLVGGWARVARTDRKLDIETSVSFAEFDTGRAMWKRMPGTMIEKCAIVKALRTAFPSTFSGMYDQAEMGIDMTAELEPADNAPIIQSAPEPQSNGQNKAGKIIDPHNASQVVENNEPAPPDVVAVERNEMESTDTPYCAEHQANYEWMVNPDSKNADGEPEGRFVHKYVYESAGKTRQGWCVAQDAA